MISSNYQILSRRDRFARSNNLTKDNKFLSRNLKRIAILFTDEFQDSINVIKWMIDKNLLSSNIDFFKYEIISNTTALENLKELYEFGYRIIIGPQTSGETYELICFINSHPELLYFNTYSTAPFQIYPCALDNLPCNLIRTALDDSVTL